MIFKKLHVTRVLFVIGIAFLQMVVSCNRNPVGKNFGENIENVHMHYKSESLSSIGQDISGRMYLMDSGNVSVYTYDSTLEYVSDSSITDSMSNYSHDLLIKDKKGSLLLLSDSNICRIKSNSDSFDIDTIDSFSYITDYIDGRYSVDDSGNVWFYELYDLDKFDYSTLSFKKWDGEQLQSYNIDMSDSLKSLKSKHLHLAAGTDNIFLIYPKIYYPGNSECSLICMCWNKIKAGIALNESHWNLTTNLEAVFVASQKLYVIYHEYYSWSSRVYLKELFDTSYKSDVPIGDSTSYFRLLKRNADEVLLYSPKRIVQVTDQISEKTLYSDCGALFLDTLNQVVLYDRYRNKFINVSDLPGF